LDINPYPLSQLDSAEERMVCLLRDIGEVPKSILFAKTPRLRIPGYSWAPASFPRQKAYAQQSVTVWADGSSLATIGPSGGLMATYGGLRFRPTITARANTWYLTLRGDENSKFSAFVESRSETEALTLESGDEYAILAMEPLDPEFVYFGALVVFCHSSASECLRARFVRLLLFHQVADAKDGHFESAAFTYLDEGEFPPVKAMCDLVDENQSWCIE